MIWVEVQKEVICVDNPCRWEGKKVHAGVEGGMSGWQGIEILGWLSLSSSSLVLCWFKIEGTNPKFELPFMCWCVGRSLQCLDNSKSYSYLDPSVLSLFFPPRNRKRYPSWSSTKIHTGRERWDDWSWSSRWELGQCFLQSSAKQKAGYFSRR